MTVLQHFVRFSTNSMNTVQCYVFHLIFCPLMRLYPFRGKISVKQYNPNKPAKYGLLYRSISDARLPYTYNTLPYAGKPSNIIPESEYVTETDNYTKVFGQRASTVC